MPISSMPSARVSLASWPTPLEAAPRLAEAIGLRADRLWLKREDLTGLGAGGNKVRKLEWTVAAALAEGAAGRFVTDPTHATRASVKETMSPVGKQGARPLTQETQWTQERRRSCSAPSSASR